jgi:hypothetical protein
VTPNGQAVEPSDQGTPWAHSGNGNPGTNSFLETPNSQRCGQAEMVDRTTTIIPRRRLFLPLGLQNCPGLIPRSRGR